eukprot:m.299761 g.299761  ORF g.299761 m.299761 type:complete len:367 (-) comp14237_c0_seq1:190-1290(-)
MHRAAGVATAPREWLIQARAALLPVLPAALQPQLNFDFYCRESPATHTARNVPPTAVLLGWAGASHAQIEPYRALYAEMGYATVAAVFPWQLLLVSSATSAFAQALAENLIAERLHVGGIVFHVFSNGGAVPFLSLAEHIGSAVATAATADSPAGTVPKLRQRITNIVAQPQKDEREAAGLVGSAWRLQQATAGCVFDSGPCRFDPDRSTAALASIMGLKNQYLLATLRTILSVLFFALTWAQESDFWTRFENWHFDTASVSEVYLYGDKDALCDTAALSQLVQQRQKLVAGSARQISQLCFSGGRHVTLLRSHPRIYRAELAGFHARCVEPWRERAGLPSWSITEFVTPPPSPGRPRHIPHELFD